MAFFLDWGRYPPLLYLLAFRISAFFVLPGIRWWYETAPLWLVGLQELVLLLTLSTLAIYLEKKDFSFSF